jgi:ribose-phosphate pyrophosphokinase
MDSEYNPIKIFSGNANKPLAEKVASYLGTPLGQAELGRFPDGEIKLRISENVRGLNVYVIQPTNAPAENLFELLILLDALKRASAASITAVIPFFGYARQDRKVRSREPISAKLVANLVTVAGADRVVAVDLHAAQIQGFFDIPADNLTAMVQLAQYIKRKELEDIVVLSPDVGGVARASTFAQTIHASQALFVKKRLSPDAVEIQSLIGDVRGKNVIIADDAIHTGNTMLNACNRALTEGAKSVIACATHAVFAGDSLGLFARSNFSEVIVTDTMFVPGREYPSMFTVLSVSELIAKAIYSIHNHSSVSALFQL